MSNSQVLEQLEQQLERSIENIRQIKIIVSDFQPQGQPVLNQVLSGSNLSGMAAIPFPCNVIVLIQSNLLEVKFCHSLQ